MSRRREGRLLPWLSAGVLLIGLTAAPSIAFAQSGQWEVEVHGGGAFAGNLSGGATNFPGSSPLPNVIAPQFPSRRVSTWFVGAGPTLANDVVSVFLVGTPRQISARIAPLDGVLNRPFADRDNGGAFGFRVSRRLTPRVAAEFNFDRASAPLKVPSTVSSGIEETATTFKTVFEGLMVSFNLPASATSSSSVSDGEGSQTSVTGAVNIDLMTAGRFIPYATAGAGIVSDSGDLPTGELQGQYGVQFQGTPLIQETDVVRLTYDADDRMFVGVFGGGVRFSLSERAGIRVDARLHLGSRSVRTLLDATPAIRTASAALTNAFWSTSNPSIFFSNNSTLTSVPSSLSGPALANLEVYEVDGTVTQTLFTVGYFFRF